jgi:hypothetical protein
MVAMREAVGADAAVVRGTVTTGLGGTVVVLGWAVVVVAATARSSGGVLERVASVDTPHAPTANAATNAQSPRLTGPDLPSSSGNGRTVGIGALPHPQEHFRIGSQYSKA